MYQFKKPFMPGRTGYRVAYRADQTNHCPGCGQTQWLIGRMTAECAYCATALPLNVGGMTGNGLFRGSPQIKAPLAA